MTEFNRLLPCVLKESKCIAHQQQPFFFVYTGNTYPVKLISSI